MSDDTVVALKDAVEQFRRGFEITGGGLLVPDEKAEPIDEAKVEQEKIVKPVPPADKK